MSVRLRISVLRLRQLSMTYLPSCDAPQASHRRHDGAGILQVVPTDASINRLHAAGRAERRYHDGRGPRRPLGVLIKRTCMFPPALVGNCSAAPSPPASQSARKTD